MTQSYEIRDAHAVKALLAARHEISARRGYDETASAIILDLNSAIESAKLSPRQTESIAWVYGAGVKQAEAARIMNIPQSAVAKYVTEAATKIAAVYKKWEVSV